MNIRLTTMADWDVVQSVYVYAREQMRKNGNPTQWGDNRPPENAIRHDIENGNHYIIEENGQIVGVFAFVLGEDPTYAVIEGKWLNDEEYGTLHKIASNGKVAGILAYALAFCESKIANVRVDTHRDNTIMRYLLKKYGYQECGIIYVDDGTPRIAYQKIV